MIYQLLHAFFGWDYICWTNSADQGVARVHVDGTGRVWYWRYWLTSVADVIEKKEQVLWLTCNPSKYLKENQA